MATAKQKTIWIDLDNSPHVPFFSPIIDDLEKRGYQVILTARDCSQTCLLADYYNFKYKRIGRHYGKIKLMKVIGLLIRIAQLLPYIVKSKPSLAVAHGSRCQLLLAKVLGIPSLEIADYEHANSFFHPDWLLVPEVIPKSAFSLPPERISTYPGIKEDAYVPVFKPVSSTLDELQIPQGYMITTIRPPAVEAHYHNHESELLFDEVIRYFVEKKNIAMIILPRYEKQKQDIKARFPELIDKRVIIVPDKAYDGLNLIWHSDFVVSGGGTMNREAAALGVPVYSIFRGTIGAVDRYLVKKGRLVLLECVDDIKNKIKIKNRERSNHPENTNNITLIKIVDAIIKTCSAGDEN